MSTGGISPGIFKSKEPDRGAEFAGPAKTFVTAILINELNIVNFYGDF